MATPHHCNILDLVVVYVHSEMICKSYLACNLYVRAFYCKIKSSEFKHVVRFYTNKRQHVILGIETSCDDTGCAVVNADGIVLGEALHSQAIMHLNNGGIIPPIASDLHRKYIESVVNSALKDANLTVKEVDAIAVTNRPGLPLSLIVGLRYAKHLARLNNKPLIPVHHMEAHALTVRMAAMEKVPYPFLVLLISGGHCLLAVARNVDDFLLLGDSLDDAPGEAFDKTARLLKLNNLPEFRGMSGGSAIESAAKKSTNPLRHEFPMPLAKYRDCQFSFAGMKNTARRHIKKEERDYDVPADGVIPHYADLCAGFQFAVARHLCHRTQRAMTYCEIKNLLSDAKHLVVSGGAACNDFIYSAFEIVCKEMDYNLHRPPPKLCTDNGIMIAWNGMEKYLSNTDIITDIDSVNIQHKESLGKSIIEDVKQSSIKCKWIKLRGLVKQME